MEHGGAELAKPFVEQAGATFPTVADEQGETIKLFDMRVVPNGVLVDEQGIVRYAKFGGFSIENVEDVAAVERFLSTGEPGPSPELEVPYTLDRSERELVDTKLRLGRLLESLGRRDEALVEWQAALRLDPENFVIRKQIWAVRYPKRFHPEIDWDWQDEQLQREREQEIAEGVCGPDGCPLPLK
jgi:tetratricopeptide (TPR) repeat protein